VILFAAVSNLNNCLSKIFFISVTVVLGF
jgi:hypothetical protein